MTFDTKTPVNTGLRRLLRSLPLLAVFCCFAFSATANLEVRPKTLSEYDEENKLIPTTWKNNIVMASSLQGTISIISVTEIPPDSSQIIVEYMLENDGMDTLTNVQIPIDVIAQLGGNFGSFLTGSGTIMTGSGSNVLMSTGINPAFDGVNDVNVLDPNRSLAPNEFVKVQLPLILGPNETGFDLSLAIQGEGTNSVNGLIQAPAESTIVSSGCQSESLACTGRVNVSLNEECIGVVRLNTVFLNANQNPLRYRVVVYEDGVAIGDTVNDSHVGKELTYRVLDACFDDRASCWGTVNVENKNLPELVTTYDEYICGEDFIELRSLEDVVADINASCTAPVSDITVNYNTSGDRCTGFVTERTISGRVDLGPEGFVKVTLRQDSIRELPIDEGDIIAPVGGPLVTDAITIACHEAPEGNPSPEFIEAYFNARPATAGSGIAFAFPHINRGMRIDSTVTQVDTIIERVVPTNVLIDSVWVLLNVVVKDTTSIDVVTRDTVPNLIGLNAGTTCNMQAKFTDVEFESCAGPKAKIKRTWSVLNWCTGSIGSFDQWIIISDEQGPNIEPIADLEANLVPWECSAEVQLTANAVDACGSVGSEQWIASAGTIDEDGVLRNISMSDNPIMVSYTATDNCGNDSTVTFQVNVRDNAQPVAIAIDLVNTSIVYDPVAMRGVAKVTVDAIDNGSHDSDCGSITRCILRDEELQNPIYFRNGNQATDADGNLLYVAVQCEYDGIFRDTISEDKGQFVIEEIPYVICKDYVRFCCEDQGTQRVALVVNDESPISAPGISWSSVFIEDKSTTSIQCTSLTARCGDDISPEAIGTPEVVYGICGGGELTYIDIEDVDGCGEGRVIREWAIDGVLVCEQTIIISNAGAFDPLSIKWPKHYDDSTVEGIRRECVNDTLVHTTEDIRLGDSFTCSGDALDVPTWCQASCSLLAVSHEDLELEADGACRKIVRQWVIIDWCNYTPNGSNPDVDTESFVAYNDEWLDGDYPANLKPNEPCVACDKPSGDIGSVYFRYGNDVDIDGYYTYQQVIKIQDNTAPEVDAPSIVTVEISEGATSKEDDFDDCRGNMDVTAQAVELCGNIVTDPSTLSWVIEVVSDEGVVLSTKTAVGAVATMNTQSGSIDDLNLIRWFVSDGCGNEGYSESIVRFVDTKAPTPVCIREISTSTMNVENGTATIWAADFDRGSYDNCSPVKIFFKDEDGFSVNSLSFSCEDIADGISATKEIKMYVADDNGNEDFCYVTLLIDDNSNICDDDATIEEASISGFIMTSKGDMVEDARVQLNVGAEDYTDVNGAFAFGENTMSNSYKLIAQKNDEPLNGVTTLDLVMIQRHILALKRFEDSHQIIAGDVSGDGRISSIDLVQLRGVILGRFVSFPTNESWRFLNPEQDWANPLVPFPFVEEVVIEDLTAEATDQNFIAVKVGDVSGNAIANSLLAGSRSTGVLSMVVADKFIEAGETVTLPIAVESATSLVGYQMTLNAANATIVGVNADMTLNGDSDFELLDNETATVTWYNTDAVDIAGNVINVTFTAKSAGYVSEMITISDEVTSAVAYTEALEELELSLSYNGDNNISGVEGFSLMQNTPNPFADNTIIGFTLPNAGEATLTVSDLTGRVISQSSGSFDAGYNTFDLDRKDLSTSGLYYYEVKSGVHSATRKMIVVE